jgi:hypothetical protein
MTLPFTLTNVSISRNTFQYKGIDIEYAGLFSLDFQPPGYLSPGVSANLTLEFAPHYTVEIACALHFLAIKNALCLRRLCFIRKSLK